MIQNVLYFIIFIILYIIFIYSHTQFLERLQNKNPIRDCSGGSQSGVDLALLHHWHRSMSVKGGGACSADH